MNAYKKPQLTPMGSAIAVIQAGLAKGDEKIDTDHLSVPAYTSDEA